MEEVDNRIVTGIKDREYLRLECVKMSIGLRPSYSLDSILQHAESMYRYVVNGEYKR